MAPSCPHVLRFDAHVKDYHQCHSTSVLLGPGATQGPGQEYSSDQSEQCCTRSRQRLLGIQSQYLKTVEGQRHHPGPQGGHAVTGGTRADKRAAVVPWNASGTPSSHTCHSSPEPHPSDMGWLYPLFPIFLECKEEVQKEPQRFPGQPLLSGHCLATCPSPARAQTPTWAQFIRAVPTVVGSITLLV